MLTSSVLTHSFLSPIGNLHMHWPFQDFNDFNFSGQQIKTFVDAVDKYAQLGLRTLCLGWRELSLEEYLEWSRLFKEASSALIDREVIVIAISFI
jgi:hypothetical protein